MDLSEPITPDADIERAFNWFTSFLPAGEWDRRRATVESYIEELFAPKAKTGDSPEYHRLIGPPDKMSWYLYLVQMSQHEPYRTEVNQAARVLPIFNRLGSELDNLLKLGGVENQAKRALNSNKDAPDSVLFEMLIGLLWYRNGYPDVSFIPTSPKEKRPDIRAARNGEERFVEAKRLSTNSAYSVKERSLWLRQSVGRERFPRGRTRDCNYQCARSRYASREGQSPSKVEVIVHSGEKDELKLVGKILGVDRTSDLAVVRVNGKLPSPKGSRRCWCRSLIISEAAVLDGNSKFLVFQE